MATGTITQVTNNSSSNYCKMPDGTLIQWGLFECNDERTSNYYELSLPIAYVDDNVTITFGNRGTDTGQEHISLYSISSHKVCTVKVVKPSGWAAFDWIAIGRWK